MININGLTFKMTCYGYPEQYDVLKKDKQVGYVRLRHGRLTCEYPDVLGEILFDYYFDEDYCKGEFKDEEERTLYLTECAKAINERLKKEDN